MVPHPRFLLLALATSGAGCNAPKAPAGEGEACLYGAETPNRECTPDLYCHPTRDAQGALVQEPQGLDKNTAVGTCRPKIAAKAPCTQDSLCVDAHTCTFEDPTDKEGHCVPEGPLPR